MLNILILSAVPLAILLLLTYLYFKDLLFRKKPAYRVTVEGRFQKYHIPKMFWDDVNKVEIAIFEMGYDELDRVSFLIDQFCDKYSQIADHRTFQHRVAAMLTRYQERKKYILSNKKFHHS